FCRSRNGKRLARSLRRRLGRRENVSLLSQLLRSATLALLVAGCGEGVTGAAMPDAAMPDATDQPHSMMVSLRGESQAALAYAGGGLWAATVTLPAGRVQLGLTVDGTDLGARVGLVPPFEANTDPAAPMVTLELPLGGPYEARFDERAGTFGLRFGADFRTGLGAPGRAL